jgi:hypothetical protein
MKTIQQLASEALSVQNACNLSGVVHSFSRALTDLRANLPNAGTDEINNHPISLLYASKIESLTTCSAYKRFSNAYEQTIELSKGHLS